MSRSLLHNRGEWLKYTYIYKMKVVGVSRTKLVSDQNRLLFGLYFFVFLLEGSRSTGPLDPVSSTSSTV